MRRALGLASALLLLAACDELEQVSRSGHGAYEVSMAPMPEGYAVAWYDDRDGNPEIYLRLLNAQGRPRSPEYRLTRDAGFSYEADVAVVGESIAVAWYERLPNGNLRARLGVWTQDGREQWTRTISAGDRSTRNVLVRAYGQELFLAWIEDSGVETAAVWGAWWDPGGQPITEPKRLAPASRTTWNLNAALDVTGAAWVVFDAKAETQSDELFLVRTDRSKSDVVRLTADDGFSSKYPDIAVHNGQAALTWYDERDGNSEVYLSVVPMAEVPERSERLARRVTNTPADTIGAYVAWNGERVGLAWCDNSAGQYEIYFAPFDSAGTPLQAALRLTHTPTESLIPAIQSSGDRFALAWNEFAPHGTGHSGGRSEIMFAFAR